MNGPKIGTYSGGVGSGALISMRLPTMTVETTKAANTKLSRVKGSPNRALDASRVQKG
jgi:hypothetical protein